MTPSPPEGPVQLDLQAAQSPIYRERGIARYGLDLVTALVSQDANPLDQVLLRADLAPLDGHRRILDSGVVATEPDWSRRGGLFHALSPYDLDVPVGRIWPREASRAGRRLVVTVYDLIPELFPDLYLTDPGVRQRYRARHELVRSADHIMTLSRSAADDIGDRLGIPDDRLTVVGAACSEAFTPGGRPDEEREAARARVPGLGERPVVYNGAVEPRKNMEELIWAFAQLPADVRRGVQLVLVCRLEATGANHYEVVGRRAGLNEGELLLTGQVPDETLVQLYRGAELVVFPSLYEGYGLPVAEAMACGAPVVAAGNSALLELVASDATFDPRDRDDMADTIERGLVDPAFRARLVAWSARPRPGWGDVAERTTEVYQKVTSDPTGSGPRQPAAWRRRPLLALITPWPPATTGVATYSRRLARALVATGQVDVELFIDGDQPAATGLADGFVAYPAWALPYVSPTRGGYDAVVACIGNSEHHTTALRLLRLDRIGAVVLAHDVRLNGLYRHGAGRGAVPEGNAELLARLYPHFDEDWLTDGWLQPAEAEAHGLLLCRELVALADRFLVTSPFAAELAEADAWPEDRSRIGVCPYAYPTGVRRADPAGQPGLICTFGLVNHIKQPELLLRAFALIHESVPSASLVYVGPVDPAQESAYSALASSLGVATAVTFTGALDDEAYEDWLGRAAVAVQLRAGTNGETSGAVADCLSHGVATVVTDAGPARALPDFVGRVPVDASPAQLAAVIRPLLEHPDDRVARGQAGLAFVADRGFDQGARDLLDGLFGVPARERRPALR